MSLTGRKGRRIVVALSALCVAFVVRGRLCETSGPLTDSDEAATVGGEVPDRTARPDSVVRASPLAKSAFEEASAARRSTGRIRDAFGAPMVGATVVAGGARGVSGSGGAFLLADADAESLSVEAPGHLPFELRTPSIPGPVDVGTLRMTGDATLKVRVVNEDGSPAGAVRMRVGNALAGPGAGGATLDADFLPSAGGRAELGGLPSGVDLRVEIDGDDGATLSAQLAVLAPGVNALDVVVAPTRRLKLSGHGPGGAVKQRFTVEPLEGAMAGIWSYASALPESQVELRLPRGRYMATAEGRCDNGRQRVVVDLADDRDVSFRWSFALTVAVTATDESGVALPEFECDARLLDDSEVGRQFDASDATRGAGGRGAGSACELQLVGDAGQVDPRGVVVAVSARSKGRFAASLRRAVEPGRDRLDVEIRLRRSGELRVHAADFAPGTRVGLWLLESADFGAIGPARIAAAFASVGGDGVASMTPPFEGLYEVVVGVAGVVGDVEHRGVELDRRGKLGEVRIEGSGPWTFEAPTGVGSIDVVDVDDAAGDRPRVFAVRRLVGLGAGSFRDVEEAAGERHLRGWRFVGLPAGEYVVFSSADVPDARRPLGPGDGVRTRVRPAEVSTVPMPRTRSRPVRFAVRSNGGDLSSTQWALVRVELARVSLRDVAWRPMPADGVLVAAVRPDSSYVLSVRRSKAVFDAVRQRVSRPLVFAEKADSGASMDGRTFVVESPAEVRISARGGGRAASASFSLAAAEEAFFDAAEVFDPWTGVALLPRGSYRATVRESDGAGAAGRIVRTEFEARSGEVEFEIQWNK